MVLDRKRKAVEGDANPVEEHKSKKTKHNAKDNVTLGVNNTLIISNKCADKIRKWSVSEEDPCFGLAWNDNAISDALRAVTNNQILGLPQVPAFLDTASVYRFKESIHDYIRQAGGGGRLGNVIGPNNLAQYTSIIGRATRDVEGNAYVQALCRHVNIPLAVSFRITDRAVAAPVANNMIAPPPPAVQVFT